MTEILHSNKLKSIIWNSHFANFWKSILREIQHRCQPWPRILESSNRRIFEFLDFFQNFRFHVHSRYSLGKSAQFWIFWNVEKCDFWWKKFTGKIFAKFSKILVKLKFPKNSIADWRISRWKFLSENLFSKKHLFEWKNSKLPISVKIFQISQKNVLLFHRS